MLLKARCQRTAYNPGVEIFVPYLWEYEFISTLREAFFQKLTMEDQAFLAGKQIQTWR